MCHLLRTLIACIIHWYNQSLPTVWSYGATRIKQIQIRTKCTVYEMKCSKIQAKAKAKKNQKLITMKYSDVSKMSKKSIGFERNGHV